jgi:hypothetical protein
LKTPSEGLHELETIHNERMNNTGGTRQIMFEDFFIEVAAALSILFNQLIYCIRPIVVVKNLLEEKKHHKIDITYL